MTSRTRRTVPLLATAAVAAVGGLLSLATPAHSVVPAPSAPTVGYTAQDDGASCRVTFTWSHPQLGGAVDHVEYAVTDFRPDPRSDAWRDLEISTRATSADTRVVAKGTTTWISVHVETPTNQPSATVQASFTC